MEIKTFTLTTADGKRNVKLANHLRKSMYDKIANILKDNGFDVEFAANGDIAIKTAVDEVSGDTFYTRLAVSFTSKDLATKATRKAKEKDTAAEVMPDLFD